MTRQSIKIKKEVVVAQSIKALILPWDSLARPPRRGRSLPRFFLAAATHTRVHAMRLGTGGPTRQDHDDNARIGLQCETLGCSSCSLPRWGIHLGVGVMVMVMASHSYGTS